MYVFFYDFIAYGFMGSVIIQSISIHLQYKSRGLGFHNVYLHKKFY